MKDIKGVYFVGKAGAGKTYSANYLIEIYDFIQSKFAFPVYGIAHDYFKMEGKDRKLLQFLGTDIGRDQINQNIWVDRFKEDIQIVTETFRNLYNKGVKFVSDDVRFSNEHEILKSMGWIGLYLDVTDEERIRRLTGRDGDAQLTTLNHSSETSIDLFKDDLIKVDANGPLEKTYQNVTNALLKEKT